MDERYLDTYYGVVSNPDGEYVALLTVRASGFQAANADLIEHVPEDHTVAVRRWRHPRLVSSPSDQRRGAERKKRRAKAPQFNAGRK